jgi:hypothetical protein
MGMQSYAGRDGKNVEMGDAYAAVKAKLELTETAVNTAITDLASTNNTPSQADLLAIQYQLQVFGVFMEFASSFEKKLSDMFESVIRKF